MCQSKLMKDIVSDDVFVIKSFESSYESDITSLLVKNTIKERLSDVLKARDKLLKVLEKSSRLKVKKTIGGKKLMSLKRQSLRILVFLRQAFY